MDAAGEGDPFSDTSDSFRRASDYEYSLGVPAPPRIFVPPTPVMKERDWSNTARIDAVRTADGRGPDLTFLAAAHGGYLAPPDADQVWVYEMRRHAQMVTPYMYLGPYAAARDRDFVRRVNITMLLAVKQAGMSVNTTERAAADVGISFDIVDIHSPQSLIVSFPTATDRINAHLADVDARMRAGTCSLQHGAVLVCCESGNEKSAAVVVAWIMEMLNLDCLAAMWFVQRQRFSVHFDDYLKILLRSYNDILSAKRDVLVQAPQTPDFEHAGRKRPRDATDVTRSDGRTRAPFVDVD